MDPQGFLLASTVARGDESGFSRHLVVAVAKPVLDCKVRLVCRQVLRVHQGHIEPQGCIQNVQRRQLSNLQERTASVIRIIMIRSRTW